MLARLDPVEVAARYAGTGTFMVLTPNTKKNLAELTEDLDAIRERGYAIDHEENTLGLVSYAVALPHANSGRNPRAVSVSLLKPRENGELRERLVDELRELVDALARHERARHGPSGKA